MQADVLLECSQLRHEFSELMVAIEDFGGFKDAVLSTIRSRYLVPRTSVCDVLVVWRFFEPRDVYKR